MMKKKTTSWNIINLSSLIVVIISVLFLTFQTSAQNIECFDSTKIDSQIIKLRCEDFLFLSQFSVPVCGCDSMTYLHRDCAQANGITSLIPKENCNCVDSSFIDTIFALKFYKEWFNSFAWAEPVCGCNGKSYLNPNMALYLDGVTQWTQGPCECSELSVVDSSFIQCLRETQDEWFWRGERSDQKVCGCDSITYRSSCWAILFGGVLSFRKGKCSCKDTSMIDTTVLCGQEYTPVCGCDSVTYDNACIAENHFGIINYQEGECPCKDNFLKDSIYLANLPLCIKDPRAIDAVCGCDGITYRNSCIAELREGISIYSDGICRCIEEETIDLSIECHEVFIPICGCDSITYFNECEAEKHYGIQRFGWIEGPCSCKATNLRDSTYNCLENAIVDPVCGCDSVTYVNPCVALKYGGVTSWTRGWCTYNCVDTTFVDTSRFCSTTYDPVCGCDSNTYANECVAFYHNGMTSWTEGKCFSGTSKIIKERLEVHVYPNPTSASFKLKMSSPPDDDFRIEILQRNGQLLLARNFNNWNDHMINLSGFPNGVYFVRVTTKQGIALRKIVKI